MIGISQNVEERRSAFWRSIERREGYFMVGSCVKEPLQLHAVLPRSTTVLATARKQTPKFFGDYQSPRHRWRAVVRLLTRPEAVMQDGMPAGMPEHLRREGLL